MPTDATDPTGTVPPSPRSEAPRGLPATMEAVVADRYGAPGDVLHVRTLDRPEPGKGEVLVQVAAAGLSRAALHLTTGTPLLLRLAGFGLRRPEHPVGNELAGTVVGLGAGVTRFAIGDEVFGYATGTCVEFAVAQEAKLAHRPSEIAPISAAALVDSASTALQAVRDSAAVQAGQRVLVLGASGGVGSFAVQIAKAAGAHVTATASTAKLGFVQGLGADAVVDHTVTDPIASGGGERFDVIIDLGGNRRPKAMLRSLVATGTLVIVGGEGGGRLTGGFQRQILAPLWAVGADQTVTSFVAKEHHRYLDELAALVIRGEIAPAVDEVHALGDAALGLVRMEAGRICGKDVVQVSRP